MFMNHLLLNTLRGGGGLPPSLRRGLVAWYDPWRQKATSGESQTLADYSGKNNTAVLGLNTSSGSDDPTWLTNALKFDGVNDIITYTPSTHMLWAVGTNTTTASWLGALPAKNVGSFRYLYIGFLFNHTLSALETAHVKSYGKRILATRGVTVS